MKKNIFVDICWGNKPLKVTGVTPFRPGNETLAPECRDYIDSGRALDNNIRD